RYGWLKWPLNAIVVDPATVTASTATSAPARAERSRVVVRTQTISAGATTNAPNTSTIHHTRHVLQNADPGMTPPSRRLTTPAVALTAVASADAPASAITSRTRSSEGRKCATCNSRYAPTTASSVLPVAMPNAEPSGTALSPL